MAIYLDYNATAPIRPEAKAAMTAALERAGNPSSVHAAGRAARATVEEARAQVAALIGAPASTVVFTSGGTEANALAIQSAAAAGAKRLIVSAIEHPSVIEGATATGADVEIMPVSADGLADLIWLQERLARWNAADGKPFVALMLANNETGVIQPVAEAAALVREADGWLHVDAIQAAGKIPVESRDLGADTLSVSGHKLGGPQGVGALTFGPRANLSRHLHGGGQERGRRAGTENTPGIAGFGAAASAAAPFARLEVLNEIEDKLIEAGCTVFGQKADRLPQTLNFAAPGYPSELQVMQMDLAGFMVSAGSACSSGKVKASHVLAAMGFDERAGSALRVSGGWATTDDEWRAFADAWLAAWRKHRQSRKVA